MTIKKVIAISAEPVNCDEDYKISYTCTLCGHKWKQHMIGEPPKVVTGYVCAKCFFKDN